MFHQQTGGGLQGEGQGDRNCPGQGPGCTAGMGTEQTALGSLRPTANCDFGGRDSGVGRRGSGPGVMGGGQHMGVRTSRGLLPRTDQGCPGAPSSRASSALESDEGLQVRFLCLVCFLFFCMLVFFRLPLGFRVRAGIIFFGHGRTPVEVYGSTL
ncbi:unnamed protein product [Discosporangium mesarthrocarpum]